MRLDEEFADDVLPMMLGPVVLDEKTELRSGEGTARSNDIAKSSFCSAVVGILSKKALSASACRSLTGPSFRSRSANCSTVSEDVAAN